jgi:Tol biopolymer transport system component
MLLVGSVVAPAAALDVPYGTIVFVSTRGYAPNPGADIYTMNPDGSNVQQVTNDVAVERDPVL